MVKVVEWTYDPSPAEWGLMIFAMINFGINAISWVYLIYWRDYPPIRAKQIDILLMSAVGKSKWKNKTHTQGLSLNLNGWC